MRWFRNHFWKIVVGAVSFALLGWQLLTVALRRRSAQRRNVENAEQDVRQAEKSAVNARNLVDLETRRDRNAVEEKLNAGGCDLGDLFDELDARASKRSD